MSVTVPRRFTECLGRPHAADTGWPKNTDRRCTTRPRFVDSWRKTIGPTDSQLAATAAPKSKPTVLVFLVKIDALIRAYSSHRVLTDDDWNEIGQQRSPAGRRGAIASRILLRLGLSQAVQRNVSPALWKFRRTSYGRPRVAEGFPDIHFSVSHTDEIALVAVSVERDIGIDVELVDQDLNANVIRDFCHCKETTGLELLPPHKKAREFLRLWTQKEAYSKLLGLGHSIDFSELCCLSGPPQSAVFVEQLGDALFEGFYLPLGHSLYYASLAIQRCRLGGDLINLRLFDVLGPDGLGGDGASDPSFA